MIKIESTEPYPWYEYDPFKLITNKTYAEISEEYPKADVYYTADYETLVLELAVPGMEKESLQVVVEERDGFKELIISGNPILLDTQVHSTHSELNKKQFSRKFIFTADDLDTSVYQASLQNGILTIKFKSLKKQKLESSKTEIKIND